MVQTNEMTFEEYKKTWLENLGINSENKLENGRKFVCELFEKWKQIDEDDTDLTVLDGSGDGGIDVSFLERGNKFGETLSEEQEGDRYYLVQGKLGENDNNYVTIISEFTKLLGNLEQDNPRLSETAKREFQRVQNFILRASPDRGDKLIWVFASLDSPNNASMKAVEHVRTLGNKKFKDLFDVEVISLRTLFSGQEEAKNESIKITLNGNLVLSSDDVLIGSVKLTEFYDFLKSYREKSGNLDQIFEKNVRMFLGSGKKVNKQIRETLIKEPKLFGLYNNGITIVSYDFEYNKGANSIELTDPHIVNGCQTTKTIHDVFRQKYDTGGHGDSNDEWLKKIKEGNLLVKIVKTGQKQKGILSDITRYTNSQNAISVKDFTALDDNVQSWKGDFEKKYGIFLEIQRGAWEAQKTLVRTRTIQKKYDDYENVFDLIKVYAAGMLELPGLAYEKNDPFAPGGYVFEKITSALGNPVELITPDKLYAAHLLKTAANDVGFGRRSQQLSRKQSRFLFYYSVIGILKRTFKFINIKQDSDMITKVLINLKQNFPDAFNELISRGTNLIDEYLTQPDTTEDEYTDETASAAF